MDLKLFASVCDQGGTNTKAIRSLKEDSKRQAFQNNDVLRNDVIVIDGQQIVPLFDAPHLLKCIRNNLLTKDLNFCLKDGLKRVAKWSHVQDAFFIDQSSGPFRTMPNISEEHVNPNKI